MRKLIVVALMSLMMTSCSALDAMKILNPDKPSVEVNANVGKNVSQEKSNLKFEQGNKEVKQDADIITNDTGYTAKNIKQITQNLPMEYLILMVFLAGWAIPDYGKTYRGLRLVVSDTLSVLILTPIKGVRDFILALRK